MALVIGASVSVLIAGCPMSNSPTVTDPRPAAACAQWTDDAEMRVLQAIPAGCAMMSLAPVWDEATPPRPPGEETFRQTGMRLLPRLLVSRESCERVLALGAGEGGVSLELAQTGSGFFAATLVEPGSVLFSASVDFTIASTPEPQTVRILDLPLDDQERCPTPF